MTYCVYYKSVLQPQINISKQMWKNSLKLKSEEFPKTELKSVGGNVP